MSSEFEAKPYPANGIYVRASLVQQMVDYLAMSKKDGLIMREVNHMAVGIDTESAMLRLPKPEKAAEVSSPKLSRAKQLEAITPESVLAVVRQANKIISTREIGDRLDIRRGDTALRGKISKTLRILMQDKVIDGFPGESGTRISKYCIHNEAATKPVVKKPTAKRKNKKSKKSKNITTEMVIRVLEQNGDLSSMIISDYLELERTDGNSRSAVSGVLKNLIQLGQVEALDKRVLGQLVYRLKKETQAQQAA